MDFNLAQIAFLVLSAVTLVSAVMVITRRNPVHSAMWLIVTLFSVGGLFLMLHAEFLFAVQIFLYVGGIMVLFLFVIMLVNVDVAVTQQRFTRQWGLAVFTALALTAELGYGLYFAAHGASAQGFSLPQPPQAVSGPGNTQLVGLALFQQYALPVEIASVLLLVAMVGAVIMAKKKFE